MSRQDQGTTVSPCPADCTTQGDMSELGPPLSLSKSAPRAAPKAPALATQAPRSARASPGPRLQSTQPGHGPGTRPHPVVTPLPPQPRSLWESFDVPFALCPPQAAPGARAGEGTRAASQVSPWLQPLLDAPPWRAALTHAGGFALAPTPRFWAAERPPCSGTSALRAS